MTDSQQNDPVIQEYENALAAAVYPDYFLVEQFCNAGTINIDYVIPPVTTTDPAAASLETGAPPLQQVKPSLGGAVFPRQQYNGALRLLSNILAFMNKGNLFTFNTSNAAGYSNGAVLWDYATNKFVVSLKNNNTANFVANPNLINDVDWAFVSVNPNGANAFSVSPTVPTPPLNDNSTKAINSAFMFANTANATKYSYPVSCKNTPTFTAGEEYLLTLGTTNTSFTYDLTFFTRYSNTSSKVGTINLKIQVVSNETSISHYTVNVLSISSSTFGFTLTKAQLNSLFSFKFYIVPAGGVVINGVTITAGTAVLTIILNNSIGFENFTNPLLYGLLNTDGAAASLNTNSNALLGITNGVLGTGSTVPTIYTIATNVANITDNNLVKWLNGYAQDSGIAASNVALLSGSTFVGAIASNVAYGSIAYSINATSNAVGLRFFAGGGQSSAPIIRGYDGNGDGWGLGFKGLGNQSVIYYEKNNSEIATLADCFGIGQTWQNVTSSRAAGTTYTNTTSKGINVGLTINFVTGSDRVSFTSDTKIGYIQFPAASTAFVSFTVPAGKNYVVTVEGGTPSIISWTEER